MQLAQVPHDIGGFEKISPDGFDVPTDIDSTGINLETILSNVIGFLTVIAGLAFLLFFLFGALQWIMAAGDSGKIDSAKKQMTNGAIGLIIVVVSYGVVAVVGQVIGLDILNPSGLLKELMP